MRCARGLNRLNVGDDRAPTSRRQSFLTARPVGCVCRGSGRPQAASASGSRPRAASAAAARPSQPSSRHSIMLRMTEPLAPSARHTASSSGRTSAPRSPSVAALPRPAYPSPPTSAQRRSALRCTCSSSRSCSSRQGLTKPENYILAGGEIREDVKLRATLLSVHRRPGEPCRTSRLRTHDNTTCLALTRGRAATRPRYT